MRRQHGDGMLAPAKLPKPIIEKLNAAIINVIALPDVRDSLLKQSFDITTSTPDEFSSLIKSELSKWSKIVRGSGMRIE